LNIILLDLNSFFFFFFFFRNHEDCVRLYISIGEICQRRIIKRSIHICSFSWFEKKPTTLFPIFHHSYKKKKKKKKNISLWYPWQNVFDFISKLHLTSKARASSFPWYVIKWIFLFIGGVRQGCSLSISFVYFIHEGYFINNCDKFGVKY